MKTAIGVSDRVVLPIPYYRIFSVNSKHFFVSIGFQDAVSAGMIVYCFLRSMISVLALFEFINSINS